MPVRDKAETSVTSLFTGRLRYSMGHVMGAEALGEDGWYDAMDFVTELYVGLMEGIDWNRLLLEAGAMCSHKEEADPDHKPKVRGLHRDTHDDENMNMQMSFCPDCLRLAALRLEKHEIMNQEDVVGTLPEDRPPEQWKLPGHLAVEFAKWLKKRKESWQ